MTLKERMSAELKEAMKAKDALKVSTLRLLNSSIKNKEIDGRRELTEDEVLGVLQTAVKQRRESIEQFDNAARADLADKERAELAIIQCYMPAELSRGDLTALVRETVSETGASGPKDMGMLMKALMPKVKGKADGKLVSELVKEALGG